jgi:dihydroorotate dehydrogenase
MSPATQVEIGRIRLKNPLIAGSAEHLIEAEGVRAALRAVAGAVVVKSTNPHGLLTVMQANPAPSMRTRLRLRAAQQRLG